jgi:hypothetical protein
MSILKQEAIRLVLSLDEQLESLEDTFDVLKTVENIRYKKLKRIMVRAESRYYRRSHSNSSPWSLMTRIANRSVEVEVPAVQTAPAWMVGPF